MIEPSSASMPPKIPPVVRWNRLFCLAMGIVNLVLAAFFWMRPDVLSATGLPAGIVSSLTSTLVGLGLVLGVANLFLVFLPLKPWCYVVQLTNLSITAAGCVFAPLCVPMILAFRDREVQRAYGLPV